MDICFFCLKISQGTLTNIIFWSLGNFTKERHTAPPSLVINGSILILLFFQASSEDHLSTLNRAIFFFLS